MRPSLCSPAAIRPLAAIALTLLAACQGAPGGAPSPVVDPATAAAKEALRNEQSIDVSSINERAIAVPALSVVGADSSLAPLGYGLADMMITDLARSSQLRLVERDKLNALLREMAMVEAGQVSPTAAPRVGRLVGARRLVVGSITDLKNGQFGVDTRLVNTVDGQISGAISARAPLASIFDAEKALVYRVFQEMNITLTPAERQAIENRPTANVTALIAYSRGVRDEAHGQYESAKTNFQAAIQADPSFTQAQQKLQTVTQTQNAIAANNPEAPKSDAPKPTVATVTTPAAAGSNSATGSVGGAAAAAAGAVNPSPAGTIGTSTGASNATQAQQSQDRGAQTVRTPIFATVVINIRQLP